MIIDRICGILGHKQNKRKILSPMLPLGNGNVSVGSKECFCGKKIGILMESEL